MGRIILAVVVALIVTWAIISLGQMLMGSIFRPPTQEIRSETELMRAYIESLPTAALLTLAFIYAVASFAGGFIVTKMSRRESPGMTLPLIIGGFLTLGGILNFFVMLPGHPTWLVILCLLIYIPFAIIGHKTAK